MRIESISLREVQKVWESNRRYSATSRSPEMLALVEALSNMSVGDARAIGYREGRNASNVKLQVQRAAKLTGKNVNVVIDAQNNRVMFFVSDRPARVRRSN